MMFRQLLQLVRNRAVRTGIGAIQRCHSTQNIQSSSQALVLPSNSKVADDTRQGFLLVEDFITEQEEQDLFNEVQPYLRKLRYEYDHWDNAIHGFRETERQKWTGSNEQTISRIRSFAFSEKAQHLQHVHVLDLSKDGYIKPHVDSVRFCGSTIAGVSLLSPCVFKLVHTKDDASYALCLVKRRSLYIMRDVIRYDYMHEVLANEHSIFNGEPVEKDRRISIICRSEPDAEDIT